MNRVSLAARLPRASSSVPDPNGWDGPDLEEDGVQIGGDFARRELADPLRLRNARPVQLDET